MQNKPKTEMIMMSDDFVKIRKGTDTHHAISKCCKMICKFIMGNGVNLKQKHGLTINIQSHENAKKK